MTTKGNSAVETEIGKKSKIWILLMRLRDHSASWILIISVWRKDMKPTATVIKQGLVTSISESFTVTLSQFRLWSIFRI